MNCQNNHRKIGIMGGTFDPIHMGHLILGEQSYEQLKLDKVLFMPAGNPPHKKNRIGRAADEQRVDMVRLAISDNPHFELSLAEMNETGYTYTYRTLEELKEYPIMMLDRKSTTSEFLHSMFQRSHLDLVPEIELSSNDLLIDLARIGLGIAFVPDFCIPADESQLYILKLAQSLPARKLVVASNDSVPLSQAAKQFMDML